jgi:hypothetical protein
MSKSNFFGGLIKTNPTLPTANSASAYGTASGVWNLEEAAAFRKAGDWPVPASPPGAPTITGVTAGNAQVDVAFNANADNGGLNVTSFTALASSGQSASGSSSPITVTGLTNGTAITFTVTATNASGTSSASSASSSVTPVNPPRGLFAGGSSAGGILTNTIEYITISSTGNATDFGDLHEALDRAGSGMASSETRALFAGGRDSSSNNSRIDYVTIASTGNASDFGDLQNQRYWLAQCSNNTRAIFARGIGDQQSIDYVTIASTGNASDFDTVSQNVSDIVGTASPTRGVFAGGNSYDITYVTIGTTGSHADFGDYNVYDSSTGGVFSPSSPAAVSSETRGVFVGDSDFSSSVSKRMEYITFSSTGNTTNFGNLANTGGRKAGVSSSVRGCYGGGKFSGNSSNVIEYITIASTGNSSDFGDLTNTNSVWMSAGSSDHGGVQ